MKPKILIVTPTMAKGGAERVVSILTNSLSEKDYKVSLVVLRLNKHAYKIASGVELIPLCKGRPSFNPFSRVYFAALTFFRFIFLLKKERPDFVISFTTSANTWTGIVCTIFRVPYIVSERTAPSRTVNSLNVISKKIVYELYKRSHALVVPSRGILHELKKSPQFTRLNNIVIINNPVSKFNGSESGSVHVRPFVLSVGRLHPVKGFDRLVEAFSMIKTSEVDLVITGEGRERDALTRQIRDLCLEGRVFLPGTKDNIQDYYKQCKLFILPSRNEGYPNALIEAMSFGCACIAFDCEFGPGEIIQHGHNGLLIPNGNITLLAQSMDMLMNDPPLRQLLSENAKTTASLNSTSAILSQWEELITHD